MKNHLLLIIGIFTAVIFTSCTNKAYKPLAQPPPKDILDKVKTSSRPSSPHTKSFVTPDGKKRITMQTTYYSEKEDSYLLVTVRRLNEAGEVVREMPIYNQKFSLSNLAGKEYLYNIEDNCFMSCPLGGEYISFGKVFPKNYPLTAYIVRYLRANLGFEIIPSRKGYVEPEEIFLERD